MDFSQDLTCGSGLPRRLLPSDLNLGAGSSLLHRDGRYGNTRYERRSRRSARQVEGQPAHMREIKLGCVFTQTTWDEKGRAIRDDDSTTYVGAIELKPSRSLASVSIWKPGIEAGTAPSEKS